jgi:hypothetical protein
MYLRTTKRKNKAGLVYVTAFPNRAVMARYLADIAWETEVWIADAPSHLIHFDGERFSAHIKRSNIKRINFDTKSWRFLSRLSAAFGIIRGINDINTLYR